MTAAPIEMMRSIVHDAQRAAKSLESITASDVEEMLCSMQEALNVLHEVQRLAAATAVETGVWSANGFRSPDRWLTTVAGLPTWRARTIIEQADVMARLPLARSAALTGAFNDFQVRELVTLAGRAGPFSDVDVDVEVTAAVEEGPVRFAAAVRRLHQRLHEEEAADRARADADVAASAGDVGTPGAALLDGQEVDDQRSHGCGSGQDGDPPGRFDASTDGTTVTCRGDQRGATSSNAGPSAPAAQSRFTLRQRSDGWWEGSLLLPPIDGELVAAALDRQVDRYLRSQRNGDPSLRVLDIPHLRAQALVDELAIRREPSDLSTPDRYQVAVNLRVQPDGMIRPDGPFPPEAICDSALFRMVLGAKGEVLDIGRTSRTWTPGMSRAIRLRDRHCRFPDCTLPGRFCDIHHCEHWEHGGETSIQNGVLLCRWHHSFIHAERWRVELDHATQQSTFYKPDGTIHTTAQRRRAARE